MFSGPFAIYYIITLVFSGIGWLVGRQLRSKFAKYSKVPMTNGLRGAEVAAAMLKDYGISDVQIVEGRGTLTDHYNPLKKTISLSPEVYNGQHVAAAAVAAHECGHAVQHAEGYTWLKMRSAIVPIVNIASKAQQILLMFALGAFGVGGGETVLLITVGVFAVTAAFSLITLPVEFDASNRALAWLESSKFAQGREYAGAKDALWWAAMTYVVAALSALVILMFLLLRYFAASRR